MATDTPAATTSAAPAQKIPADVLPLMDSARAFVRAQQMNPVEKRAEASRILHQIQHLPSAFAPGLEAHEKTTREGVRNEHWARYHAFKELENENDLTPERRALLLERARKELPRLARYGSAFAIVADIEAEHDVEESFARRKLKEWRDEAERVVSDCLSEALSAEQIAFLNSFHGRGCRRQRFRVVFTDRYPRRTLLVDVPVRAPYLRQDFQEGVKRAETLKEVKALLAVWDVAFRVERREEGAVVVADGFEIYPVEK